MKEFYVKVPDDQEIFFSQLLENLGYKYEKLFDTDKSGIEFEDEQYFTDADD